MRYELIDDVLDLDEGRITARKQVTAAEEYLADHFPGFPILPGVMMLEVMVQAARRLLDGSVDYHVVLGSARAIKYGAMVRPGQALKVEVTVGDPDEDGVFACFGTGIVEGGPNDGDTAISGRFTMRSVRLAPSAQTTMQESDTTC